MARHTADLYRVLEPSQPVKDLIPPHHHASEVALLGSMIIDGNVIPDVLAIVSQASDFYDEHHVPIFNAILHVVDKTNPAMLDLVMIQKRLMALGVYEKIGGEDKLRELVESVPSSSNAAFYAKIVAEKALLRRAIAVCQRTAHACYHVGGSGHDSAREVIDEHEAALSDLDGSASGGGAKPIGQLIRVQMERIERADSSTPMGTPTGFAALDGMIQGFQDGEVVIVAGRPSMGKTGWGLNVVENIGLAGTPVGVFSLEMGEDSIAQRLMSSRSRIPSQNLRAGVVGGLDMRQLVHAVGQLSEAPIYVDDTASLTVMELRARARRMVKQYGVKAIVVDYLQLITDPTSRRDGRFVEVSAISRNIKALARELKIPLVVLAQLNRSAEGREGNRPRMSDLALSGSIEQDADVILLLHRPEYYHIQDANWIQEHPEMAGLAELIIAKNRNGPTGIVNLDWDAATTRFSNRHE